MNKMVKRFETMGYAVKRTQAGIVMMTNGRSGQAIYPDGHAETLPTSIVNRLNNNEVVIMSKYTVKQLEEMSETERTQAYNEATGKNVKRMRNKRKAIEAILASQGSPTPAPSKKKASPKKKAAAATPQAGDGVGYKNHRAGSRKATCHMYFDNEQPDRVDFIAFCQDQGIKATTASSWLTAFRKG